MEYIGIKPIIKQNQSRTTMDFVQKKQKQISPKQPRNELSLEQKNEVIKFMENNSERKTAIKFGIGKTTVHNIKKRKAELLERFKSEGSYLRKIRKTDNSQINTATINWFYEMSNLNCKVTGPMLQEMALKFAKCFGKENFKASNGWLDSFKRRYNIKSTLSKGNGLTNDSSSTSIKLDNYSPADVFNACECELLYKDIQYKSLLIEKCEYKDRVKVLLAISCKGEKIKPLVIGQDYHDTSILNELNELPVTWKTSSDILLTNIIFTDYLKNINELMKKDNRNILIMINSLPENTKIDEFTNLKLKVFNSPVEQSVTNGILNIFQEYYSELLTTEINNKIDLTRFTITNAVKLILKAWNKVTSEIMGYASLLNKPVNSESDIVSLTISDENNDSISHSFKQEISTFVEVILDDTSENRNDATLKKDGKIKKKFYKVDEISEIITNDEQNLILNNTTENFNQETFQNDEIETNIKMNFIKNSEIIINDENHLLNNYQCKDIEKDITHAEAIDCIQKLKQFASKNCPDLLKSLKQTEKKLNIICENL